MANIPITIIIPIYNGESYIDRCLQNLLLGSYKSLEIVVVDDGSKDKTGVILDAWAKKDSRLHVLHTENKGVSSARNTGIKYAVNCTEGVYYHFVDIDDVVMDGTYNNIMKIITESGIFPDILVFGYTTILLDKSGNQIRKEVNVPAFEGELIDKELTERYFEYFGIRKGLRNSVCNKLFKASVCNRVSFRTDLKQAEDLFFNIDALSQSRSIYLLPKTYYIYYKQPFGKDYYDSDIQMAFDRNKAICDRLIQIGVNKEDVLDEYYHKVLDTTYDNCMLIIRGKSGNRSNSIRDSLKKLSDIRLPNHLHNTTLQQKSILVAKKIRGKYIQYGFLKVVFLGSRLIWISRNTLKRIWKI